MGKSVEFRVSISMCLQNHVIELRPRSYVYLDRTSLSIRIQLEILQTFKEEK